MSLLKKETPKKSKASNKKKETGKTRKARPYPASSFSDALTLGNAIMKLAAGEKVRRLTLLEKMENRPRVALLK